MLKRTFPLVLALVLVSAAAAQKRKAPGISVPAPADGVRAVLFAEMTSLGYQLKTDKKDRIVYEREMRLEDYPTTAQIGGTFTDPPQETVTFRLKHKADVVTITATAEAQYRDNLGLTRGVDLTHDKVMSPRLQGALDDVKLAYDSAAQRKKAGEVAKEQTGEQKPD